MQPYYSLITVLNLPLQSHYLYNGNWTSKVDVILIDAILYLKSEKGWKEEEFPSYFLMLAAREIHDRCGVAFTEADLAVRVCLLAMRCRTFKDVITSKGTYWDRVDHFVHAADSVWVSIMENKPFAAAYYYHDEPEYYRLVTMFGFDDANEGHSLDVIRISSSNDDLSSEDFDFMDVDADDDEVNSPANLPKPSVRRKLFVKDDDPPVDRESTTNSGFFFIDVGPGGNLRARYEPP